MNKCEEPTLIGRILFYSRLSWITRVFWCELDRQHTQLRISIYKNLEIRGEQAALSWPLPRWFNRPLPFVALRMNVVGKRNARRAQLSCFVVVKFGWNQAVQFLLPTLYTTLINDSIFAALLDVLYEYLHNCLCMQITCLFWNRLIVLLFDQ